MDILSLFFIFLAIELFEANWQKSDTLYGMLQNNYSIYKINIFLFFLLNSSFIYTIFLIVYLKNYSILLLTILGIKFLDISLKINLMNKISNEVDLENIMPNINIGIFLRYANVIIYPFLFLVSVEYFH